MASITQRGGKWRVRVTRKGHTPITKTFDLKRVAEAFAATVEADLARGTYRPPSCNQTFKELLARYLLEVTPTKRGASQEGYLLGALLRPESVARPMLAKLASEVQPADVAAWRDARMKEVKPATLAREWAVLSHILATAEREWSLNLPTNPFTKARKPAIHNGKDRRITDEEIDTICQTSESPHLEALVRLALETGARRGELLALRWPSIDLKKRTARLDAGTTKNGHARVLPLSSKAVAVLSSIPRHPDGKVFDLRADSVTQAFSRAVEHARRTVGKDKGTGFLEGVTFHGLRHECLSRLAEAGWSATEIAAVSGHRTMQMVSRYVHHRPEALAAKLG